MSGAIHEQDRDLGSRAYRVSNNSGASNGQEVKRKCLPNGISSAQAVPFTNLTHGRFGQLEA